MRIRPLRPDDAPRLEALFRALSEESRRLRFLGQPADACALAEADAKHTVAFVGEHEGRLAGDARYTVNPSGESGEFGIVVADAWRGRGVAQALMRSLLDAARAAGLKRMNGLVLAENVRMLRFTRSLGFEAEPVAHDPSMLRVTKRLTDQ